MNRASRAPIPDAWRRSVEAYHDRIEIRRLGKIAQAERQRELDEVSMNANADMSPFADRGRRRRVRETEL